MSRRGKKRVSMALTPREIAALLEASRITEAEIEHWHADFLHHCPSGEFDKSAFIEYYKKLDPPDRMNDDMQEIFEMIDVNQNGTIDFNEFLVVVVLTNRMKDLASRLSFTFDMWDESGDGQLDQKELANVITAIYDRAGITDRKEDSSPKKRAKEIIAQLDLSGDQKLSKEEFITGCKNDPVIRRFLTSNNN